MTIGETRKSRRNDKPVSFNMASRVVAGSFLVVLLVGGVGGWAMTAKIAGAVIAQGAVAVDGRVKAVQHRDGGIISEINVSEGDRVEAGQVLLRLDDAQTRAELAIIRAQLGELSIRRARLTAERDQVSVLTLPADLDPTNTTLATSFAGEKRLFDGNRQDRDRRKQQLRLTIQQTNEEIRGLSAQRASKQNEGMLILAEMEGSRSLSEKGLMQRTQLFSIEREHAQLEGENGEIDANIARARARISEIELEILALDGNGRTEAQRELITVETRFGELNERRIAVEDLLSRTDIRAPIDGVVNELNIHTLGGVITPAEVLVTLVPGDPTLTIAVKLSPANIDRVALGQIARLRFSTFNQRTTPELTGELIHISAASTLDQTTGEQHFIGQIRLTAEELAKLPSRRLLPGTPVEVFLQTEERTALSYLAKPLTDQFNRAFRER